MKKIVLLLLLLLIFIIGGCSRVAKETCFETCSCKIVVKEQMDWYTLNCDISFEKLENPLDYPEDMGISSCAIKHPNKLIEKGLATKSAGNKGVLCENLLLYKDSEKNVVICSCTSI